MTVPMLKRTRASPLKGNEKHFRKKSSGPMGRAQKDDPNQRREWSVSSSVIGDNTLDMSTKTLCDHLPNKAEHNKPSSSFPWTREYPRFVSEHDKLESFWASEC